MHRKIHPLVGPAVVAVGILSISSVSSAAVLVKYDFGTAAEANLSPSTTGSGVTSAAIVIASGLSKQNSGVTFAGSSGPRVMGLLGTSAVSGNLTESLAASQYFTFSLTAVPGQKMDLTNITFFANTGASGREIARTFELQVSTDGTNFTTVGTSAMSYNDLTAAALYNISLASYSGITAQTTFRMAFYDAENDNDNWGGGNWIRLDDITVNGTVSPIPEASTVPLGALGVLAFFRRKR